MSYEKVLAVKADVTVPYRRQPTQGEIKFGYGCLHYIELLAAEVLKPNGDTKRWTVVGGLRYYRV